MNKEIKEDLLMTLKVILGVVLFFGFIALGVLIAALTENNDWCYLLLIPYSFILIFIGQRLLRRMD